MMLTGGGSPGNTTIMWRRFIAGSRRFWPYYLLTALVMLPLLRPGFIFALDMSFAPTLPMPSDVTPSYLLSVLLHILDLVLPAMMVQKLLLVTVILLPGIGMHRLLELWKRPGLQNGDWLWACYVGGLLYAVNPFVYSRFMTGQYAVLLGYGLLPFVLWAVWRFFERPGFRRAWPVALLGTLVSIVSVHALGPAFAACAAIGGLWWYRRRAIHTWRFAAGRWIIGIIGAGVIASSYWLVPLIRGQGSTAAIISGFSSADQAAFAVQGEGLGRVGNVLGLQGFWADATGLYLMPQDVVSWWWLAVIALWLLVVVGIMCGWRLQRGLTIAMLFVLVSGVLLSLSTTLPGLQPLFAWLSDHSALAAGYREPQKFAMLIALAYAYFGSMAIVALLSIVRQNAWLQRYRIGVIALTCTLPLLCAPLMPWGFYNQFTPRDYPADWYTVNSYLNQHLAAGKRVLFLPWHLYMEFDFAERIIAVPADKFFDASVITSNDPEYGGAASYMASPVQQALGTGILPQAAAGTSLGAQLSPLGIQYVLVAKTFDHLTYSYLDRQTDLALVKDSQTLRIYKVQ
jgi:hypothetical protein